MKYSPEDFKDNRGALKTELLFEETIKSDRRKDYSPMYTLRDQDTDLPSAYRIYIGSVDEYEAALRIVGSTRHWRRLCGLRWFMEGIPEKGFDGLKSWRKDMEMRDKSKAKKQLMESAEGGNVSAQRALYLNDDTKTKRTRTKKEEQIDRTETDRLNNIRAIFGEK